jgi:hypothetical protein
MANSSMTFTYDDGTCRAVGGRTVRKIICDWLSDDTTGAVSGTTEKIVGYLVKGVTDPGSPAPTDNYDIAITDEEGVDVLAACIAAGRLADRDTATTEQAYFFVENVDAAPLATSTHPIVCDKLTISITNAGNAKAGQLILYYRDA